MSRHLLRRKVVKKLKKMTTTKKKKEEKEGLVKASQQQFSWLAGPSFSCCLVPFSLSLSLHLLLLRTDEKGGYIQYTQHTRYDEADATDDDGLMDRPAKGPS